jgi:hypothetical protein
MSRYSIAGPIVLIVLGLLFLLNNFGFRIPIGRLFRDLWPMFLIVPGILNMLKASAMGISGRRHGLFTGGVMLVTVGVLFLIDNFTEVGFGRTWPLLLISAGIAGVVRFSSRRTV